MHFSFIDQDVGLLFIIDIGRHEIVRMSDGKMAGIVR